MLGENEEGRRRAARPTLFYLPHCEADLCSNLVEANLGCGTLAVVLGNSFALYHERWTQVVFFHEVFKIIFCGVIHLPMQAPVCGGLK